MLRIAEGGLVYHVLNRGNARRAFLHKAGDFAAFERVLGEAKAEVPMRILAYCLLPNHWHLVFWPHEDRDLSRFMAWLTLTHTQRWHAHYHNVGTGHLYQGRFKSFPVQEDDHFYTVCRYVERNGLRAKLVSDRAEQMALVQPVAACACAGSGGEPAQSLALALPGKLDGHGQRSADGGGIASIATECKAEPAVWRRRLGRGHGGAFASGPNPASARSTPEKEQPRAHGGRGQIVPLTNSPRNAKLRSLGVAPDCNVLEGNRLWKRFLTPTTILQKRLP